VALVPFSVFCLLPKQVEDLYLLAAADVLIYPSSPQQKEDLQDFLEEEGIR